MRFPHPAAGSQAPTFHPSALPVLSGLGGATRQTFALSEAGSPLLQSSAPQVSPLTVRTPDEDGRAASPSGPAVDPIPLSGPFSGVGAHGAYSRALQLVGARGVTVIQAAPRDPGRSFVEVGLLDLKAEDYAYMRSKASEARRLAIQVDGAVQVYIGEGQLRTALMRALELAAAAQAFAVAAQQLLAEHDNGQADAGAGAAS